MRSNGKTHWSRWHETQASLGVFPFRKCRGLPSSIPIAVDELPDDTPLDPEPSTRLCNPQPTKVGNKAVARNRIQQLLTLRPIGKLSGKTRRQGHEFVPWIFKASLAGFIGIDEPRIRIRIMRQDHEGSIVIEPLRSESSIDEGQPDDTSIASNKQIEELAIKRQI